MLLNPIDLARTLHSGLVDANESVDRVGFRSRIRNLERWACLLFVSSLAIADRAHADLVLSLSGAPGSAVVAYQAAGSVTLTLATPADSSTVAAAPVGGLWDTSFDNNLGDILSDFDGTFNDNLPLSGEGIVLSLNTAEFGVWDMIDLDPSSTIGGDDIQPDFTGTLSYPAATAGDVFSISGTGTFSLELGTFDSIFTDGSFSNPIDGGNYVVNVNTVPEPSAAVYLSLVVSGVASLAWLRTKYQNRQQNQQTA